MDSRGVCGATEEALGYAPPAFGHRIRWEGEWVVSWHVRNPDETIRLREGDSISFHYGAMEWRVTHRGDHLEREMAVSEMPDRKAVRRGRVALGRALGVTAAPQGA